MPGDKIRRNKHFPPGAVSFEIGFTAGLFILHAVSVRTPFRFRCQCLPTVNCNPRAVSEAVASWMQSETGLLDVADMK